MAYDNGKIPLSAMTALSTGGHLLAPAAAAFETWRLQAKAAGFDMRPTSSGDAYRTYATQERIFRDRYRAGNHAGRSGFTKDVRYWHGYPWTRRSGTAAAAVPGTSNHGKGLAVDIKNAGAFGGDYHNWMSNTGPKLGFTNVEGRSVNEPWHWVHNGVWTVQNPITGDGSNSLPNPGGNIPDPLEEDFMSELTKAEQRALYNRIMGKDALSVQDDQNIYEAVSRIDENAKVIRAQVTDPTKLAARVWGVKTKHGVNGKETPMWQIVRQIPAEHVATRQFVANLLTKISGIESDEVREALLSALKESLPEFTLTLAPVQGPETTETTE